MLQKFLQFFLLPTFSSSQVNLLRNSFILKGTMNKREWCKREILKPICSFKVLANGVLFRWRSSSEIKVTRTCHLGMQMGEQWHGWGCLLNISPLLCWWWDFHVCQLCTDVPWRLKKRGTVLKKRLYLTLSEMYIHLPSKMMPCVKWISLRLDGESSPSG